MNKTGKKIIGLSALGGMLELYDFAIYGTFSIYFANQFFPSDNPYTVILQTYMVFLLGFILRPIGGILFSHIGDEYGRKRVLVYTIFIMGISSLGIALIPTYAQIGIAAPICLLICRMLQGLALGGELPTTFVYISESLPTQRLFAFGITMAGIFSGYLLAAAINFILMHVFDAEQLKSFGWRIPFLIGGLICFISYQVRKSLYETPDFNSMVNKPKLPIIYLLRYNWPQVIFGISFSAIQQVFSVVTIIFMPTYFKVFLHLPNEYISYLLPFALVITVMATAIGGIYFNKIVNFDKLMFWNLIISIISLPIFYYLIAMKINILGGYMLLMVVHGLIGVLAPFYLTTLFPSNVRLSGVALCYNLSIISFAGFAPIILTELIKSTDMFVLAPALYIALFLLVALIILISKRKSARY